MGTALLLLALTQAPKDMPMPKDPLWDLMDYGPFLTTAVTMPRPQGAITPKAVAIKVGSGTICFDTDLVRYAAAWDGGWLELLGPPFEGSRSPDDKTRPKMRGTLRMATHNVPGVLRGNGQDPRPEPYGPVPADLAKYHGLYVHGDRVVLSYTAGGCEILDLPGYEKGIFTRTLRLGASAAPVTILVGESLDPSEPTVQGRRITLGSPGATGRIWRACSGECSAESE